VIASIKKLVNLLRRTLPIFWQASPLYTLSFVAIITVRAIIPGLSIWVTKLFVDNVVASTQGITTLVPVTVLILLWGVVIAIDELLAPWASFFQGGLNEKVTERVNFLLMEKANSFEDITIFEDSQFYNDLQLLQRESRFRPLNLAVTSSQLLQILISLIVFVTILASLAWWLPIVVVAAGIPQLLTSLNLHKMSWNALVGSSPEAKRMQYTNSVLLTDTYAKEIRLFDLGKYFINHYLTAFKTLHTSMTKARGTQAIKTMPAVLVTVFANVSTLWWVIVNATRNQLTPGDVLLFVQSLAQTQNRVAGVSQMVGLLQEHLLFFAKLFSFLDLKPNLQVNKDASVLTKGASVKVTFENVTFNYPDGRMALDGVSFTINSGERVALVGENGAGKSTIVKLIARLYEPTSGTIYVDDIPLQQLDLHTWRKRISVVWQDFCRYQLSVAENIEVGNLDASQNQIKLEEAAKHSDAHEFITQLQEGYDTKLGKQFDGTELSGGQWQKLALARAFFRDGDIVILDEPTSSLDPRSEQAIYEKFATLSVGKSVLLVTHRLASVTMTDKIIVLKQGRVIESGRHQELMNLNGEYADLFTIQAESYVKSSQLLQEA
jgi:ATP-binding cassette, subfamily B, bacterial